MNFLGFIFTLLFLLSTGTFLMLEHLRTEKGIEKTFLSHSLLNRKIFSQWTQNTYQHLKSIPKNKNPENSTKKTEIKKKKEPKIPTTNPACAKLNIWPLIENPQTSDPFLLDIFRKMIDTTYGSLFDNPSKRISFLNALLKNSKNQILDDEIKFEKVKLNSEFSILYYLMQKGTIDCDEENGYPPLQDLFIAKKEASKICIHHAHPQIFIAIFGIKAGNSLYTFIHDESNSPLTFEALYEKLSQFHIQITEEKLSVLFDISKNIHATSNQKSFRVKDPQTQIVLRKNLYTNRTFEE